MWRRLAETGAERRSWPFADPCEPRLPPAMAVGVAANRLRARRGDMPAHA